MGALNILTTTIYGIKEKTANYTNIKRYPYRALFHRNNRRIAEKI